MYVDTIYDELKTPDVLGTCDDKTIFTRLSDAVVLVSNQGILDPFLGEMDLCVCSGCVTLPMEVGTVLAVNRGGFPTLIRDQWYQYHINGSGSDCCTPCSMTNELGQVSTFKDPDGPVQLIAEVESAVDTNKMLRVYGWDENGKRIYTPGESGLEDGFLVPTIFGFSTPNPTAPLISRIDRVQKDLTNGFIRLMAINPTTDASETLIGYYRPDETNPSYRRIGVGQYDWVRIKYKKKNVDVRSKKDWINIDNREIIILAVKAVNFRRKNQIDLAKAVESEAIRLLNNEADSKRPPGLNAPQIMMNVYPACEERLFY